jgi:hypothetical protein
MPLDSILSHWQPVPVSSDNSVTAWSFNTLLIGLLEVVKWAKDYVVHPLSACEPTANIWQKHPNFRGYIS